VLGGDGDLVDEDAIPPSAKVMAGRRENVENRAIE